VPATIAPLAAADDYTELFVARRTAVLPPKPLHKLLERLLPNFVWMHRSDATNVAHLESFRQDERAALRLRTNQSHRLSNDLD